MYCMQSESRTTTTSSVIVDDATKYAAILAVAVGSPVKINGLAMKAKITYSDELMVTVILDCPYLTGKSLDDRYHPNRRHQTAQAVGILGKQSLCPELSHHEIMLVPPPDDELLCR